MAPLPVLVLLITYLAAANANSIFDNDNPHLLPKRFTMVHLFEWKWEDIAAECENFLAKHGYGAVQISPPAEHLFREIDIDGQGRKDVPWYVRYQPTSYKLVSRSGDEKQLKNMIDRCNKVGVRIVVDLLLNHMAGAGQALGEWGVNSSGGTFFNSTPNYESFPGANYTNAHFNDYRCDGDIQGGDYNTHAANVRNCRLSGLVDLNQGHPHVRDTLVKLLNKLIAMGVVGFRLDAAKHMWPGDLEAIINRLDPLNKEVFGEKERKPFIVHEVIDKGGEAITVSEYVTLGRYTNFNFGIAIANAVQNWDSKNFASLADLHEGYNYGNLADHEVVNFVDNHDNQRYERDHLLTHKKPEMYKLAVGFMLAWTYGYPRVMSSYYFDHTNQGPPSTGAPNYQTKSPTFSESSGMCNPESGWVCEHRWPEIRRMVKFRSDVTGGAVTAIYKQPSSHVLAFARLAKGYFAANNADVDRKLTKVDTTLPAGNYCNVYAVDAKTDGKYECSVNYTITVDKNGQATFVIPKRSIVAFSLTSKTDGPPSTPSDSRAHWNRTIIFLKKNTSPGQNIFIRGGNADKNGCLVTPSDINACTIPISHTTSIDVESDLYPSVVYSNYQEWKQGDYYLDFVGSEYRQGTHDGVAAEGTPMIWTTNDSSNKAYHALNAKYSLGDAYWMVDLLVNCEKTDNGTFEFKAVMNGKWEPDVTCNRNEGKMCQLCHPKISSKNHFVRCGAVNVFEWGKANCKIYSDM